MTTTNGLHPSTAETGPRGRLDAYLAETLAKQQQLAEELRELLAGEEQVLEELANQATASRARRDHLKRALEHLTGDTQRYGRPQKQKKQTPVPGVSHRPKQEYLDQLLALFREAEGRPLTHSELVRQVGFSSETVTRSLRTLRAEELIRLSSQEGNRKLYALMPDA